MQMPQALKELIDAISMLPGIGEKTAAKLAFFLLKSHPNYLKNFSDSLKAIQEKTKECPECNALMDDDRERCTICDNPTRDESVLCIVEDYLDLIAIENTGVYKGSYHVLGGAISPMNGISPMDLSFELLFSRLKESSIEELVIATNPNFEGEATAMYLKENLPESGKNLQISRLSRGLPNAGYIEYADEMTLMNAFNGRQDF